MVEKFRDEQRDDLTDSDMVEELVEAEEAEDQEDEAEVPEILPILPLRGTVVFPLTLVPLAAGQARSLRLIDEVVSGDRLVAMVLQKDPEQEGAGPGETYEIGTVASIHQMMRVP